MSGGSCVPDAHGHCSLCGDEAVPGVVIEIDEAMRLATVRTGERTLPAALDLLDDEVRPGDTLLVHQGFAITKVAQ